MACTFVQSVSGATSGSQTQLVLTMPGASTAGNAIRVSIFILTAGRTIGTVNDGAAYTKRVNSSTGQRVECWSIHNITSGTKTITITVASSQTAAIAAYAEEFSGGDNTTPVSVTDTAELASNTTTHPCATTSQSYNAGDLVVGVGMCNAATGTITPFSGFTKNYTANISATDYGPDQSLYASSSGGPATFDWTSGTSRQHKCLLVVFAAAATGTNISVGMSASSGFAESPISNSVSSVSVSGVAAIADSLAITTVIANSLAATAAVSDSPAATANTAVALAGTAGFQEAATKIVAQLVSMAGAASFGAQSGSAVGMSVSMPGVGGMTAVTSPAFAMAVQAAAAAVFSSVTAQTIAQAAALGATAAFAESLAQIHVSAISLAVQASLAALASNGGSAADPAFILLVNEAFSVARLNQEAFSVAQLKQESFSA